MLVIYTNSKINVSCIDDCDIFHNNLSLNDLYEDIDKTYYYYLFINCDVDIKFDLNKLLEILKKYKPAILTIHNLKIYHRSVLHYFFPIYTSNPAFLKLLEYPLKSYCLDLSHILHLEYTKIDYTNSNIVFNWFKSAIKWRYFNSLDDFISFDKNDIVTYQIPKENITQLIFLNKFNIHLFFDIN